MSWRGLQVKLVSLPADLGSELQMQYRLSTVIGVDRVFKCHFYLYAIETLQAEARESIPLSCSLHTCAYFDSIMSF